MKKSYRLNEGDVVAVVSPSWGGPSVFPKIYDGGIKFLENDLGLQVKEYPTARASDAFLKSNPKARAEDINNAFADKKVKAIFATIGGDDSVRILPYLDRKIITNNPKILMGYSDTTTLLTYINQLGLVTFNGPAIMSGFFQADKFPQQFKDHVREMLFEPKKEYQYRGYEHYSEGYQDWSKKQTEKLNPRKTSKGWKWLQGKSVVQGELFGGCIAVLEFMKGTEFWPKPNFWKNKILFLETSEDKPSPTQVKWMLRNYGMQGVYDKIKGLLFGRPRDYSDKEKKELDQNILEIIAKEFNKPDLPIITNMDFGHTDPQIILPLGIKSEIDCINQTIHLTESPLK